MAAASTMPANGRPLPLGQRSVIALLIALAAAASLLVLGIGPSDWVPSRAGREILGQLASAAVRPALHYEAAVPAGTAPLLWKIVQAIGTTVLYAAAAMGLALPAGLLLGALSADVTWQRAGTFGGATMHPLARLAQWTVRIAAVLLRSVHELLWAVLFLAAFGLAPASAVIAIAIPFAGTIAKVTAGILDEAPREAALALDGLGAGRAQWLLLGLAPVALADLASYAFYRFECALRSAAVLGFFGAPTIGTYVFQSYENLQFREMWSYLYALIAAVLVLEWLGARLRSAFRAPRGVEVLV